MQRELQLRIISGVILGVVVLAATWLGGGAFRFVAAAIGILIYYEWMAMTGADKHWPAVGIGAWAAQALIAIFIIAGFPLAALAVLIVAALAGLILMGKKEAQWWLPAGIVYAGLTGIALAEIRGDDVHGLRAMFFVFAVVWATDIMAYFIGRAIGGPKLAPRISPGKTWSGAIGGAAFAVIAGALVAGMSSGSVATGAAVALLLSICSQSGDLFESFVKRRFGVKDSSHLIPGHGGVMDRVDGLIIACCAAFLLASIFSLISGAETASLGAALLGV